MDDATLDSLRLALKATPENDELFAVVFSAFIERDDVNKALEIARDCKRDTSKFSDELCSSLVHALLDAGLARDALQYCDDAKGDAALKILHAEVLLSLGDREAASATYQEAILENTALQDLGFEAELEKKVVRLSQERPERPRETVVANDNTDESDVVHLLHPSQRTICFDDVGGLEGIKKQIRRRIITPFQKPSLFERFRRKAGGGILLYGPPGCGKTLLARATAGECGARFFNVEISDVLDMYIGESERKLHALFEHARSNSPAILFFDEVEALGGKRQFGREATSAKLVSQFLSELDGFAQNNDGLLILAATNVPWSIDPAFRRPGRFDRVLFVPPPDREGRIAILEQLLKDRPVENIRPKEIAKTTSGFSGADLEDLVNSAADEAIEESMSADCEIPISSRHIQTALKNANATTAEWLTSARNYARYANESGQYNEVLDFLAKHGRR